VIGDVVAATEVERMRATEAAWRAALAPGLAEQLRRERQLPI